MKIFIAFMLVILTGCAATKLVHPTKTAEEMEADWYDCDTIALQRTAHMGGMQGNPLTVGPERYKCMQLKHGWKPVPLKPTATNEYTK
jgi:hypothetical protein